MVVIILFWISNGRLVESPLIYHSSVFFPSGSRCIRWLSLSANLTILSSILGQYLGPVPQISPLYKGDKWRLSLIISEVCFDVLVVKHFTCSWWPNDCSTWNIFVLCSTWNTSSFVLVSVNENLVGVLSPNCSVVLLKSILEPSILGGVPVLNLPRSIPIFLKSAESPFATWSPILPPTDLFWPTCISALRNVPVVTMTV